MKEDFRDYRTRSSIDLASLGRITSEKYHKFIKGLVNGGFIERASFDGLKVGKGKGNRCGKG